MVPVPWRGRDFPISAVCLLLERLLQVPIQHPPRKRFQGIYPYDIPENGHDSYNSHHHETIASTGGVERVSAKRVWFGWRGNRVLQRRESG